MAGVIDLPSRNGEDIRLVFFEPLWYRGLETGLKKIFHLPSLKIIPFFEFLGESKGGTLLWQNKVSDFDDKKYEIIMATQGK